MNVEQVSRWVLPWAWIQLLRHKPPAEIFAQPIQFCELRHDLYQMWANNSQIEIYKQTAYWKSPTQVQEAHLSRNRAVVKHLCLQLLHLCGLTKFVNMDSLQWVNLAMTQENKHLHKSFICTTTNQSASHYLDVLTLGNTVLCLFFVLKQNTQTPPNLKKGNTKTCIKNRNDEIQRSFFTSCSSQGTQLIYAYRWLWRQILHHMKIYLCFIKTKRIT